MTESNPEAQSATPDVADLREAVEKLDSAAIGALIVQPSAWGLTDAKALAIWSRMQATKKGKYAWNKQKPARQEGEEEEAEEEEEEEEEEPVNFEDEEWLGETTDAVFGARTPAAKFELAKAVKFGLYEGGRAARPEGAEAALEAVELTARTGFGVALAPAGDVYAGEWAANKRAGCGAMLYAKGGLYVGGWANGLRHGAGKMSYVDGSTYDGAWAFGKRHGKGTFTYANGDRYVGAFFKNAKDGRGVYLHKAAATKFDAQFGKGQMLAGKATTADGSTYYGAFKKGAADGRGAWLLANGVVAEGTSVGTLAEDADPEDAEAKAEYAWHGGALTTADSASDMTLRAKLCAVKKPLQIVISGPPAGGKGTQCESIKAQFGVHHISTGDMLRAAAADPENEIGQACKSKMEAGELVPDELICALLQQELDKPEVRSERHGNARAIRAAPDRPLTLCATSPSPSPARVRRRRKPTAGCSTDSRARAGRSPRWSACSSCPTR
jgi:hypothetical protein